MLSTYDDRIHASIFAQLYIHVYVCFFFMLHEFNISISSSSVNVAISSLAYFAETQRTSSRPFLLNIGWSQRTRNQVSIIILDLDRFLDFKSNRFL